MHGIFWMGESHISTFFVATMSFTIVDDSTRSACLLACFSAAVAAYFIPRLLPLLLSSRATAVEERKSRLLEHRFGTINDLNDLVLRDEGPQGTTEKDDSSSSDSGLTTKPDSDLPSQEPEAKVVQDKENGGHQSSRSARGRKPSKSPTTTTNVSRQRQSSTPPTPLPLTDTHPGFDPFLYWWDVQTSLYRIYTVHRWDGQHDPPPYNPSSRRGNTKVALRVTNHCAKRTIQVCWINYKGGYEDKGTIAPAGGTWVQTTFIDHPWVLMDADTQEELASYIPYKIIPSVHPESVTVDDDGGGDTTGIQRFTVEDAPDGADDCCRIVDPILPFRPAIDSEGDLLKLALLHCLRTGYIGWDVLLKYLENLDKGHRVIRISNPTFHDAVWNCAARGVLLALGFVEEGAYVQMPVRWSESWKQTVLDVVRFYKQRSETTTCNQPDGADGYGRAGYGM